MKASIIVLTYNSFDSLERTIESILKQTYDNYEVIVSDDGSSSFDKRFIESLYKNSEKANCFRIISHKVNVGTVRNYNRAIEKAVGDIIVPLSSDDEFYDKDSLSDIVTTFQDKDVNICYGLRMLKGLGITVPAEEQIYFMQRYDNKKLWLRNACGNLYYGASLYYRKEYIVKMGLFDERYVLLEDFPIVMKSLYCGEKIRIISKPTIIYDTKGISSGIWDKSIEPKSLQLIKDDILLFGNLRKDAEKYLNSKICKNYLSYKKERWERKITSRRYPVNIWICIIVLLSKLYAVIVRKSELECRFNILWKIERIATLKKTLMQKNLK